MNINKYIVTILGAAVLAVSSGMSQSVLAEKPKPIAELVRVIDTSHQGFTSVTSVAIDAEQNVYVTDNSEAQRVLKYDKRGRFVRSWGGPGSGPGQFIFIPPNPDAGPTAGFLALDSKGYVFVSDAYNSRVQKFDSDGHFIMQFGASGDANGQFDLPCAGPIYIDKHDNIWVSTFPRVQKFDRQGHFLASYGSAGSANGQFMGAALGAVDKKGNQFIADLFNARVQKLDANGHFLKSWGTPGTGDGQFFMPVGIVLDDQSRLFVADNSNRIQIFNTDGQYVGQWDAPGKGYPAFGAIAGIAGDRQGNIYVADSEHAAIYVFRVRPS